MREKVGAGTDDGSLSDPRSSCQTGQEEHENPARARRTGRGRGGWRKRGRGASADGLLTSWTKGGGTTGRSALVQKYLRTFLPAEGQVVEGKIETN